MVTCWNNPHFFCLNEYVPASTSVKSYGKRTAMHGFRQEELDKIFLGWGSVLRIHRSALDATQGKDCKAVTSVFTFILIMYSGLMFHAERISKIWQQTLNLSNMSAIR